MPTSLGEVAAVNKGEKRLRQRDRFFFLTKKFTRSYEVLSDDLDQSEDEIIATTGVPVLFSNLNGAYCIGKRGREKDRIMHPATGVPAVRWHVDCEFDSDVEIDEADQPPEARTPKIRWYGEEEEEVLEKDIETKKPIQTVPGEPILVTRPIVRPILEVSRYELFPFDPAIMLDYADRINSVAFWGAPEGTARMLPMEVEEEHIGQVKYNRVTYRIKFRMKDKAGGGYEEDTWKREVLHHGSLYIEGGKVKEYKVGGGRSTVNLDAAGAKLGPADPAVFLSFNQFNKKNFNALNLGPF